MSISPPPKKPLQIPTHPEKYYNWMPAEEVSILEFGQRVEAERDNQWIEKLSGSHWTSLDDMTKSELDAFDYGAGLVESEVRRALGMPPLNCKASQESWHEVREFLVKISSILHELQAILSDKSS